MFSLSEQTNTLVNGNQLTNVMEREKDTQAKANYIIHLHTFIFIFISITISVEHPFLTTEYVRCMTGGVEI